MESSTEADDKTRVNKDQPFNSEEAAALLELSPRQKAFADYVLKGCTQTRAAELAGYAGTGSHLRSTASGIAKSEKVRAYWAWARNGKAGLPDDPATLAEIERTLSQHLRGSDKNASLRASELLTKLHIAREESAKNTSRTPTEVLDEMAKLGPIGVGLALWLSRMTKVAWKPPVPATDGAVGAFEKALLAQLTPEERARVDGRIRVEIPLTEPETPGDKARRRHIERLQNSPGTGLAGGDAGRSQEAPSPAVRPAVGPSEAPESWLRDGGHPAHVAGALTREQAQAAAALMKRRK